MDEKLEKSIHEFSGIMVISALAGISGAVIVAIFTITLEFITKHIERVPLVPGFLFPLAGAFIAGVFILRYFSDTRYDGTFSYIQTVNHKKGKFNTPATFMKIPATLVTLGCCGSGGIVGPLSRIGAGISSLICPNVLAAFKIKHHAALRTAAICGMSGIISTIFHSPLGGAFFAVEILSKKSLKYSDLFPSIPAGGIAVITSCFLGQNPVFMVSAPPASNNLYILMLFPLAGIMSGATGLLFITIFEKTLKAFKSISVKQPLPVLLAGTVITTLWLFGGSEVLGTSMPLFRSFADGKLQALSSSSLYFGNIPLLIVNFLILKMTVTSLTVGSGMSGGLTGPLLILGVGCGALLCSITGIEPGSAAYYAILVCSLSGILASALNIPVASILLATAIFGHSYIIPAIIGSILPFLLFKKKTMFKYSEADGEKAVLGEVSTRRDDTF